MADFNESTGSFNTQDRLKIFYRQYQADPERARMVIAHGLGEHSGRYGNIVERLLPKGITIWALDHRGHGQSDGPRGHILAFNQYISDVSKHLVINLESELPGSEDVLYSADVLGGHVVVKENRTGEESRIELETLFNAVISNKDKINSLFAKEGRDENTEN